MTSHSADHSAPTTYPYAACPDCHGSHPAVESCDTCLGHGVIRTEPEPPRGESPKRSRADHAAAHEALLREAMVALSQLPEVLVLKLTQWAGETNRGTHMRAGMRKGALDLCLCVAGRTVWLDAKTGGAELTPEQLQFQVLVRAHGGKAEAFRTVDQAIAVVRSVINVAEIQDPELVARVRKNHAGRARLAELEKALAAKRAASSAKKLVRTSGSGSLNATRECARGASTPGHVTHRKASSDE